MNNLTQIDKKQASGSCLCGAVKYSVQGKLRDVINCHCGLCRKFHGHHGAYTSANRECVHIKNKSGCLAWYQSIQNSARRGFCVICGSSMFWDLESSEIICIAAGTFDTPTGLKTTTNIYVNDKADYYEIDEMFICYAQGLKNPD